MQYVGLPIISAKNDNNTHFKQYLCYITNNKTVLLCFYYLNKIADGWVVSYLKRERQSTKV